MSRRCPVVKKRRRSSLSVLMSLLLTIDAGFDTSYGKQMDRGILSIVGDNSKVCVGLLGSDSEGITLGATHYLSSRLSNFAVLPSGMLYSIWAEEIDKKSSDFAKLRTWLIAEQILRLRRNAKEMPTFKEPTEAIPQKRQWYRLQEYLVPLGQLFREVEDKGQKLAAMTDVAQYAVRFHVDLSKCLISTPYSDEIYVSGAGGSAPGKTVGLGEADELRLFRPWTWSSVAEQWSAISSGLALGPLLEKAKKDFKAGPALSSATWRFNHHHVFLMRNFMPKKNTPLPGPALTEGSGQLLAFKFNANQNRLPDLVKRSTVLEFQAAE